MGRLTSILKVSSLLFLMWSIVSFTVNKAWAADIDKNYSQWKEWADGLARRECWLAAAKSYEKCYAPENTPAARVFSAKWNQANALACDKYYRPQALEIFAQLLEHPQATGEHKVRLICAEALCHMALGQWDKGLSVAERALTVNASIDTITEAFLEVGADWFDDQEITSLISGLLEIPKENSALRGAIGTCQPK